MLCHLSALAGFVIPFGNILGPLLVWQIKKNEIPSVEAHGKAALNFQITVTIAALIGMVVAIVLSFVCVGFLLIPLVILIGLAGLVFCHHRRHQGPTTGRITNIRSALISSNRSRGGGRNFNAKARSFLTTACRAKIRLVSAKPRRRRMKAEWTWTCSSTSGAESL